MTLAIRRKQSLPHAPGFRVGFPAPQPADEQAPKLLEDSYVERLIKLVPAEVVTAYVALQATVSSRLWSYVLIGLGALAVPTVMYLDTRKTKECVPWYHYALRTLAFLAWVQITGKPPLGDNTDLQHIGVALAVLIPVVGERLLQRT